MKLRRVISGDFATYGNLITGDHPFALTLEDPWNDNAVGESCIPAGTYTCQRVISPHFGETFEVTHVPGRTHILFHKGNLPENTKGCILVAERFDPVGGYPGIAESQAGFDEFLKLTKDVNEFTLEVIDP